MTTTITRQVDLKHFMKSSGVPDKDIKLFESFPHLVWGDIELTKSMTMTIIHGRNDVLTMIIQIDDLNDVNNFIEPDINSIMSQMADRIAYGDLKKAPNYYLPNIPTSVIKITHEDLSKMLSKGCDAVMADKLQKILNKFVRGVCVKNIKIAEASIDIMAPEDDSIVIRLVGDFPKNDMDKYFPSIIEQIEKKLSERWKSHEEYVKNKPDKVPEIKERPWNEPRERKFVAKITYNPIINPIRNTFNVFRNYLPSWSNYNPPHSNGLPKLEDNRQSVKTEESRWQW